MEAHTDGPSRRTLLAVLTAATVLFTVGDGAVQVLLSPFLQEQGIEQGMIGIVSAAYSVAAFGSRFLIGVVYRPERGWILVPLGCAMSAVAFSLMSTANDPLPLIALNSLNGAGFAFTSTGALAGIMDLTDKASSGSAMGWYTGFIGVGYGLAGILGGLSGDTLGLAVSFVALAFLPSLAGVALGLVLRHASPAASQPTESGPADPARAFGRWRAMLAVGPAVWVAFAVALHLNLLSGVLLTYFPLYGLAIGLSLTQIGALTGMHSGASALIRFAAPLLYRRVRPEQTLLPMVLLGGLAVASMTVTPAVIPILATLAAAWLILGLCRGILRVGSATIAMRDSRASDHGAASSIYLSGFDLGKIIGPLAGAVAVPAIGYTTTFLLVGLSFPMVFLVLNRWLHSR